MISVFNASTVFDRTVIEAMQEDANTNLISSFATNRIQIDDVNPRYWKYNNETLLLVGGSSRDNLFQQTGTTLTDELDTIVACGGNYVRNTMSSRDLELGDIHAYYNNGSLYDLDTWNDAYWQRFEFFLQECKARNIIVQIEVWDRFDYYSTNWNPESPWRPLNNINYTNAESGFSENYDTHPSHDEMPFFYTVPDLLNNTVVLPYQQAFVRKMLSYSLNYDNVLYCMDNETKKGPEWGWYWADFIRTEANLVDKEVEVTEMWDDITTFDASSYSWDTWNYIPNTYTFSDISNGGGEGEDAWDGIMYVRNILTGNKLCPITRTKIYGYQGTTEGTALGIFKMLQNFLGGLSSSRFHRPQYDTGLGIMPIAQQTIAAVRSIEQYHNFFNATPDATHTLLSNRATDEAYLSYEADVSYVVFFHGSGGNVNLNLSSATGDFNLNWINMDSGTFYGSPIAVNSGGSVNLAIPATNDYGWVAIIKR